MVSFHDILLFAHQILEFQQMFTRSHLTLDFPDETEKLIQNVNLSDKNK